MAGQLVKIAKEFNVATTTIVEFLSTKGFPIENKPNAKISDDMHELLSKEFKSSADIKEKADQIQIGASFKKAEEKPVIKVPIKIEIPKIEIAPKKEEIVEVTPPPPPPVETKAEEVIEAKAKSFRQDRSYTKKESS